MGCVLKWRTIDEIRNICEKYRCSKECPYYKEDSDDERKRAGEE